MVFYTALSGRKLFTYINPRRCPLGIFPSADGQNIMGFGYADFQFSPKTWHLQELKVLSLTAMGRGRGRGRKKNEISSFECNADFLHPYPSGLIVKCIFILTILIIDGGMIFVSLGKKCKKLIRNSNQWQHELEFHQQTLN